MQLLPQESEAPEAIQCGRDLLDTVPGVMRSIRLIMRRNRSSELSIPQFRTLCFLNHFGGSSLSAVADYLDLSLPAMSRMVNALVKRGYVLRRTRSGDRRLVSLSLSVKGQNVMRVTRHAAETQLARDLESLSAEQRAAISAAMNALRDFFPSDRPAAEREAVSVET